MQSFGKFRKSLSAIEQRKATTSTITTIPIRDMAKLTRMSTTSMRARSGARAAAPLILSPRPRRGGLPSWRQTRGGGRVRTFAKEDEDELYDYSTEKVRSLLKRDSKELRGVEELGESAQSFQPSTSAGDEDGSAPSTSPSASPASPFASSASPAAKSPFAGTGGGAPSAAAPKAAKSPFAGTGAAAAGGKPATGGSSLGSISSQKLMSPFKQDAQDMDVQGDYEDNDRPWWQPQITITQVAIALSFSLLVVLMLATFSVVLNSGAIRFNDT